MLTVHSCANAQRNECCFLLKAKLWISLKDSVLLTPGCSPSPKLWFINHTFCTQVSFLLPWSHFFRPPILTSDMCVFVRTDFAWMSLHGIGHYFSLKVTKIFPLCPHRVVMPIQSHTPGLPLPLEKSWGVWGRAGTFCHLYRFLGIKTSLPKSKVVKSSKCLTDTIGFAEQFGTNERQAELTVKEVDALDSASVSAHPSSGIRYRSLLDLGNNKATPCTSICTSLGQPVAGAL